MFMVLCLHVNFMSIGYPTTECCHAQPVQAFFRIFFEMICIISVNLFVFISGWFSIKPRLVGFLRFIFQCVVVLAIVYCIGLFLGYAELNFLQIREVFFAVGNGWFITAYAFLYILSPVLNKFCEEASEKTVRNFLIAFYIFQTVYGNILQTSGYYSSGYSAFSFMGVYIVARYMRLYGQRWYKYGLRLYMISAAAMVLIYYFVRYHGIPIVPDWLMAYTSPLNILACIGLVCWVANKPPRHNRAVNFIAASAFAVYLCHVCLTWTVKKYVFVAKYIFENFSGLGYLLVITGFMLSVFCLSIIIDRIRIVLWNLIEPFVKDKLGKFSV